MPTPSLRHSWNVIALAAVSASAASSVFADTVVAPPLSSTAPVAVPVIAKQVGYEVVTSYPHDTSAFTEGLLWHSGSLYESTGLEGKSTLRQVDLKSGRVVHGIALDPALFGEGIALVGDRLIQLTWRSHRGFVHDLDTFKHIGEFSYPNEGWGLTYDGHNLIMSDGSDTLTYLDPMTFRRVKTVKVSFDGEPLTDINELEYIDGEIWANVWQTDRIVRIDPASGAVTSYLDLAHLRPAAGRAGEDVLNGIAYDPTTKRIFVTGKLWSQLFVIRPTGLGVTSP